MQMLSAVLKAVRVGRRAPRALVARARAPEAGVGVVEGQSRPVQVGVGARRVPAEVGPAPVAPRGGKVEEEGAIPTGPAKAAPPHPHLRKPSVRQGRGARAVEPPARVGVVPLPGRVKAVGPRTRTATDRALADAAHPAETRVNDPREPGK